MNTQRSPNIIEMVNRLVRTSRQMMHDTGQEPTLEELASGLAISVESVIKLWEIARTPIRLNG